MPRPRVSLPAYFVVTIRPGGLDSRTVGWFNCKDDAVQVIRENMGDINEDGYYRYAMVEELGQGLYPVPNPLDGSHETWFSWKNQYIEPHADGDIFHEAGYYPCDKPAKFDKVICWAVG